MKHAISTIILLSGIVTGTSALAAESPTQVTFGLKLQPSTWEGKNKNGADFDAQAGQLQFNIRFRKDKFYGGVGFQGGKFEFDEDAPRKVNDTVSVASSDVTIERGEFDLVFGYYFWPQVSLFIDLKSITNTWQDDDYSARYGGLGFGVSGFYPLNPDWIMFGSLGVVRLNIKAGGDDIGDGRGSALEFGALLKIDDHHSFTFSVKSQHNEYEFDQGSEQTHDIGGLVFGYNYTM